MILTKKITGLFDIEDRDASYRCRTKGGHKTAAVFLLVCVHADANHPFYFLGGPIFPPSPSIPTFHVGLYRRRQHSIAYCKRNSKKPPFSPSFCLFKPWIALFRAISRIIEEANLQKSPSCSSYTTALLQSGYECRFYQTPKMGLDPTIVLPN